jgi:hypothetical protein
MHQWEKALKSEKESYSLYFTIGYQQLLNAATN